MSINPPPAPVIEATDTRGRCRTGMTVWYACISARSVTVRLITGPPVNRSSPDSIDAIHPSSSASLLVFAAGMFSMSFASARLMTRTSNGSNASNDPTAGSATEPDAVTANW
jgi:hypothetical protein